MHLGYTTGAHCRGFLENRGGARGAGTNFLSASRFRFISVRSPRFFDVRRTRRSVVVAGPEGGYRERLNVYAEAQPAEGFSTYAEIRFLPTAWQVREEEQRRRNNLVADLQAGD